MVEESRKPFRTPTERQLYDSLALITSFLFLISLSQRHVGRSFGSRSNLCGKTLILADRTGSIVWSVWTFHLNALNRITEDNPNFSGTHMQTFN